jgi:peptidoglycan hydrolase CwlO-like protein
MRTSIQIADYYMDNVDAYNKQAGKVGLALTIDEFVAEKTKPLEKKIKQYEADIESLQAQIQFLEDRIESRRAING